MLFVKFFQLLGAFIIVFLIATQLVLPLFITELENWWWFKDRAQIRKEKKRKKELKKLRELEKK